MEEYYEFSIGDHREVNKMGLDTFCFDKENILDHPVDKLIDSLHAQVEKCLSGQKEVEIQIDSKKQLKETEWQDLEMQRISFIEDVYYIENELNALYEIKIIYAFKHLESNIKKLLSAAYNDKPVNKQFNWEKLLTYLKSKKIDHKSNESYSPVNELRLVNNTIQHSGDLSDQTLNGIPEFKEVASKTDYKILHEFYDRIKNAPLKFLEDLSGKVYSHLYEYSEERIEKMAESIALQMNKEDAVNLITKVSNNYK